MNLFSFSFQAIESEAVMVRFHGVHDKLTQTLDNLPDELCISDEVSEQVNITWFIFFLNISRDIRLM